MDFTLQEWLTLLIRSLNSEKNCRVIFCCVKCTSVHEPQRPNTYYYGILNYSNLLSVTGFVVFLDVINVGYFARELFASRNILTHVKKLKNSFGDFNNVLNVCLVFNTNLPVPSIDKQW